MKQSLKKKVILFWKGWGYSIFIAVLIATSFKSAIADWYIVPTGSMKPTIVEGDRVFVDKLSYDLKFPYTTWHIAEWDAPQRGAIVVFPSPIDGTRLIKRVVGIPGDSVEMQNDQLIINGKKVKYETIDQLNEQNLPVGGASNTYRYIEDLTGAQHPVMFLPQRLAIRTFGPLIVPEGKYFMMGDNRNNSADSRYFGFVDRSGIVGQARFVVISLDLDNHYKPRWERFFTALL
ncbi:MAG: signal peptidase I [Proteobacteria bacterium]|nr:signal peptidase I [Pseudomonadota bacterium]MBU1138399.1 signal peptidase I [Pseudomonadota bacterium]MBU1232454.1 signal peptidase I [Pseudomonadota bacterium]MBU1418075.1 signal peptidase I [Pseudomonadota bacterium]MBU1454845.1 signal peptidase I [Pseudomonadota bacterium]